ncbi:MAG: zinc transport system permease protein [Thermovirga sp.]|nr:zinc transport system permease protein [Thermovirga sp.]
MIEALQFDFMRNALLAGLLISVACGIVGTFVVTKRIVFLSGSIAHAAYGGIGLGYFLGFNPLLGAFAFSLAAAVGMSAIQRRARERSDTLIGALWAIGMAVGIILIDLSGGYKADLMSYLFGSILMIPQEDLWLLLALDLGIMLLVRLFYKELVALSFDETFSTVQNIPVGKIHTLLVTMTALTVVMMMRMVGLIMVIALLTMPAAISGQFAKSLKKMMVLASILGAFFILSGLWLSYWLNLTSGACIILVAGVSYLASLAIKNLI